MQAEQLKIYPTVHHPQALKRIFTQLYLLRQSASKLMWQFLIGTLIFLITGTISLLAYQYAYAERVMPNLMLAGQDVSGFTKSELVKAVAGLKENYRRLENTLVISPTLSVKATFEEMGVEVDQEATVEAVWEIGHKEQLLSLARELLADSIQPKNILPVLSINRPQLDVFVNERILPLVKSPVDASLEFKDGQVNISDSQRGLAIDTEEVKEELVKLAKTDQITTIFVEATEVEPTIKKENLVPLKLRLESLLADSIVIQAGEKSLKISQKDLSTLISFEKKNGQINAVVNSSELESYLKKNERKLVEARVDRQILEGTNQVIREGKDGTKINLSEAKAALDSALSRYLIGDQTGTQYVNLTVYVDKFTDRVIRQSELASASAFDAAAAAGRSLVVDISEQRLTAFENGQVVNSFLISSGVPGMETPRGVFYLDRRVYSKLYSGRGYYLPNTLYNMHITGPYWLHGAYWHNNFGHKMSHGCVNVSYPNAEWLWNWTSIGTQITIQD